MGYPRKGTEARHRDQSGELFRYFSPKTYYRSESGVLKESVASGCTEQRIWVSLRLEIGLQMQKESA